MVFLESFVASKFFKHTSAILCLIVLLDKSLEEWGFVEKYEGTTNVLGLVTFSIVFGVAIGTLGDVAKPLLVFFHALSEVMMAITSWVIW